MIQCNQWSLNLNNYSSELKLMTFKDVAYAIFASIESKLHFKETVHVL